MNRIYLLILAALFVSGASAQGKVENGKRLWVKSGCYQCHGYDGHGGSGPRLAPKPLPAAALIAYVRHPAPGDMPIYSPKVMSDAELMDVVAWLQSIPPAKAAKDIPLLAHE